MGFVIVYIIVVLIGMAVLGFSKYELTSKLKIQRRFNDRFFTFISVVMSTILLAFLLINGNAIMSWFDRFQGNDFETIIVSVMAIIFVSVIFGGIAFAVGKFFSLVWLGKLREKRASINALNRIAKKK